MSVYEAMIVFTVAFVLVLCLEVWWNGRFAHVVYIVSIWRWHGVSLAERISRDVCVCHAGVYRLFPTIYAKSLLSATVNSDIDRRQMIEL